MRALIWGIAQVMTATTLNDGIYNCINNNPFEINTNTNQPGALNTYIKKQSCVNIGNDPVRLVKFDDLSESIQFMVSFMSENIKMIDSLVGLNTDVDVNRSYGKSLFQLAFTTWITPLAIEESLDANGIKNRTIEEFTQLNGLNGYNAAVELFTRTYEYFKQNPT